MEFVTKYNYTPPQGEKNSGEIRTDTTGFTPRHIQIQNFINSGEILKSARSNQVYDTEQDTDDVDAFFDPTLQPMYDVADASTFMTGFNERLAGADTPQVSSDGSYRSGNNNRSNSQTAINESGSTGNKATSAEQG